MTNMHRQRDRAQGGGGFLTVLEADLLRPALDAQPRPRGQEQLVLPSAVEGVGQTVKGDEVRVSQDRACRTELHSSSGTCLF